MFDFRERFSVQAPKGPYVGYGVYDVESGHFLTSVDLPAEQAMTVAAVLMSAAAPRDLRHAGSIREMLPPRAAVVGSRPAILAAWAVGVAGWLGFILVDGEMQSGWMPAAELRAAGTQGSPEQPSLGASG